MSGAPDSRVRWDEAMLTELQERWKAGQSAGEIAWIFSRKLAVPMTRSAVLGKLNRLGLLHRVRTITARRPQPPRPVKPPPPPTITPSVIPVPVPAAAPIPLVELESWHCRWPMWGHDERPARPLFCGHVALEGRPYCPAHVRKATARA